MKDVVEMNIAARMLLDIMLKNDATFLVADLERENIKYKLTLTKYEDAE